MLNQNYIMKEIYNLKKHKYIFGISLLAALVSLTAYYEYIHVPSSYQSTSAIVTNVSGTGRSGRTDTLQFISKSGVIIAHKYFHFFDTNLVNSKQTVWYNPANPHQVKVKPTTPDTVTNLAWCILIIPAAIYHILYGITVRLNVIRKAK